MLFRSGQHSAALLTHSVDAAARFFCCGLNSGDAGANSGFLIVLPGGSVWNVSNVRNVSSMVRNVVPRVTGFGVSTAVNFVVGLGATVLNVSTGRRVTAVLMVPTVLILHCADSSLAKHLALVAHQPQLEPLIHDEQLVRAEHANSTTPVTEGFVSNGISSAIKQHFELVQGMARLRS